MGKRSFPGPTTGYEHRAILLTLRQRKHIVCESYVNHIVMSRYVLTEKAEMGVETGLGIGR
jgi:hypothetical protein